ncbi:Aste57867_12296 [Aphanomyces stellatus]|uniref:Aste57867_12296 protein n=1 Tax=Aphanomyces stellatus TaxID=120398 RepID=A0A485KV86_9STRA|nr:hypothetical protein As57867_012250 [Aphanomyces stellatus]VFT89149.1 Aste57867_12296 [Aphanomyces stellatus]
MTSSDMACAFKDCDNDALRGSDKCKFHKARKQCSSAGCLNIVYARNLCVRHGGKKKCLQLGCKSNAYGGDYCGQHGGVVSKRFCKQDGCDKQAHARGLCVRHGGGRICTVVGCIHHAREGGLCQKHLRKDDSVKVEDVSFVASNATAGDLVKQELHLNHSFQPHETQPYSVDFTRDSSVTQVEFLHFLDEYFDVLPQFRAMWRDSEAFGHSQQSQHHQPVYIL